MKYPKGTKYVGAVGLILKADAVRSEMWEVGGKTLRGCRVPVHPGQRDPVQGGRVCRDGDGGLEDGFDEGGADSQLHLQHRVLLSLGLWTEAGLADLGEFQLPAESKGLQEGISIPQDGPGNSIDMRVNCEKLVLFFSPPCQLLETVFFQLHPTLSTGAVLPEGGH